MKTTVAVAVTTALLIPLLPVAAEPFRPMQRLASSADPPAAPDWIDLGEENSELYLAANYVPGEPPGATALLLSTAKGAERLRLDIEVSGHVHLWLYPRSVSGPKIDPTKPHRILVRIRSHSDTADEVFVKFAPGDTLPAEPKTDSGWTLINRTGFSNGNLAGFRTEGGDRTALTEVRHANAYAGLEATPPDPPGTSADTAPVSSCVSTAHVPGDDGRPRITHENLYQMDELVAQGADPNDFYYLYPGLP